MTPVEVLSDLVARGIRATVADDRIVLRPTEQVTTEIVAVVRDHKPALLTLLMPPDGVEWRAEAMRPQIPARGPIPVLVAVPGLPPTPGRCFSCCTPLPNEPAMRLGRCTECALAAIEALGGSRGVADAALAGRLGDDAAGAADASPCSPGARSG
jgi:hypothetical protein